MRRSAATFVIMVTLAITARAGIVMAADADAMHGMDAGCVGLCAAGDHAVPQADCIDHCLTSGTLHPIDAIAGSLLLLLAVAASFVAVAAAEEGALLPASRGMPRRGRSYALDLVASDVRRE